jgi:transcription antitermination factor NusB
VSRRHRARRLALQGLCCLDVQGAKVLDLVREFVADSRENAETLEGARRFLIGAFEDVKDCDELLARHARHWELSRLALVDRNILRLGAYELRAGQTPHRVVISEAIRLAKEFSSADSSRFINGVLDAIAREVLAGAEPAPEQSPNLQERADGPVSQDG